MTVLDTPYGRGTLVGTVISGSVTYYWVRPLGSQIGYWIVRADVCKAVRAA